MNFEYSVVMHENVNVKFIGTFIEVSHYRFV